MLERLIRIRKYGPQLDSLIQQLGRYFQIRDDYQNLASSDVSYSLSISEIVSLVRQLF